VECSIQNPESLPKNFALLKIVQKTLESDTEKKVVVLKYQEDTQKFIATKKEDKSLASFLRSPSDLKTKTNNNHNPPIHGNNLIKL
jgi:hypothetical protein